jgi:type III restriction enzyme
LTEKPFYDLCWVDFTTKRSHVNAVVLDSKWEQTAFYLEQQRAHVICYVRNDRPFLLIPNDYEGVQHHYEPDYIVKHKVGLTIHLEVKCEEIDLDHAKYQAVRRWVSAINNWERLGRWDFMVCKDPVELPGVLADLNKSSG